MHVMLRTDFTSHVRLTALHQEPIPCILPTAVDMQHMQPGVQPADQQQVQRAKHLSRDTQPPALLQR